MNMRESKNVNTGKEQLVYETKLRASGILLTTDCKTGMAGYGGGPGMVS